MPVSLQKPYDSADDYHALTAVIKSLLGKMATSTLVKVVACTNSGGVSPIGTVDVVPLVNQVTGDGQTVEHGTLYRLPYFRLQGGQNMIIIDPAPGDIGLAAFCSRDISAVKADPEQAAANVGHGGTPPGSAREFNLADGVYWGSFLSGTPQLPQQYVQMNAEGVRVVSPTSVRVEAPSVTIQADATDITGTLHIGGNVTGDGTAVFQGDVTGQGVSLHNHLTGGVTPGGGQSGLPIPS